MEQTAPINGRKKTKTQIREEIEKEIKEEFKKNQQKKEKLWTSFLDILDTLSMLVAAASGIVLSKYIPEFREGVDIIFVIPSWSRLIISFVLSIGVIAITEVKGNKEGKKKNWLKRLWFSFSNGVCWHTILGF